MARLEWLLAAVTLTLISGCQASVVNPPVSAGRTSIAGVSSAPPGTPMSSLAPPVSSDPVVTPSPEVISGPLSSYVPKPQPSIALFAAGAPAIPTKVRMVDTNQACDLGSVEACVGWRVTWVQSDPAGVTVRVYAVTQCLHTLGPGASGDVKCLVSGDTVPPKALLLLGAVPASSGALTFLLATGEASTFGWIPGGGPSVYAVVVQAINANGGSLFAFAAVSGYCPTCTL